jgi:hypothetical protein
MTLARVSLTIQTVNRIRFFFLLRCCVSKQSLVGQSSRLSNRKRKSEAYLEILIGRFLPFFGHGSWRRPGERMKNKEKGSRNSEADPGVQEDLFPFSRRGLGAWTMRTKCNPPSCIANSLVKSPERSNFSDDMLVHDIHKGVTNVAVEDPPAVSTTKHTSFLLLQCQFVPINFHSISQLHP